MTAPSEFVVAFTGHRPNKFPEGRAPIAELVRQRLVELQNSLATPPHGHARHDLVCLSGMALGFDQWAAQVCEHLRIPFEAVIPFAGQEQLWPPAMRQEYGRLLGRARKVHVVSNCNVTVATSKKKVAQLMQDRNEYMVDRAGLVLAAWDGSLGGTFNTVEYANRVGKSLENLLRK